MTGPGDLLAFAATGAYTYSLASTYNRVGRPAVVAVREGAVTPWLRREDAADLDRLEVAAVRPRGATTHVEGIAVRPARPADARSYLAFWTTIVEEGRHVRTERVTNTVAATGAGSAARGPIARRRSSPSMSQDRVVGHLYIQREGPSR